MMERTSTREYKLVILSIFLAICSRCNANDKTPIIHTASGPVQGYIQETLYNHVSYSTFKGIPFAEAPIGNLRFKPPVPKSPWTEVLNATEEGPTCPQFAALFNINQYMGDEDCLNLNVYTPVLDFNGIATYPVMVWIYGGAFVEGYKNQSLYGPDMLIEEGVILVVPNYRLGVLGFLNLGLPDAHGNAGMMDQVLALKWVQKNIAEFGGDPNNVMIFGQNAGSASIVLQNLSPQSEGLFQGSIAQSGSPLIYLSETSRASLKSAHLLADMLGFDTVNRTQLLESYRNASAYDLVMSTRNMYLLSDFFTKPFKPSIENTRIAGKDEIFLSECPISLMMNGKIHKGPKMIGYTSDEFAAFVDDFARFGSLFMPLKTSIATFEVLAQTVTNTTFAADIELTQRFFAAHNHDHPVYYYVLTYADFPHHQLTKLPVTRAANGDDFGLLFTSLRYGITDSTDSNDCLNVFRRKLLRLWVNFARDSNPTPKSDNPRSNSKSKMITRSLGASGSVPESIYYYRLPRISGCRQISYATQFKHLFSSKEATISPFFDGLFQSHTFTSALSSKNIASLIRSIDFDGLIKSLRLTSCFGSNNISFLVDPHHENPLSSSVISAAIESIQKSPAIHSFIDFLIKDLSILWSSSLSLSSWCSSEENN